MNWTGGKLSRHSRAAGSLTQRQKQHFAKAHNDLRNGSKNLNQLKLSIFGNIPFHRPGNGAHPSPSAELRNRHEDRSIRHLYGIPRHSTNSNQHIDDIQCSQSHGPQHKPHPSPAEQVVIKREIVPDDDLYNATPPPRKKREHKFLEPLSDKQTETNEKEELAVGKRRRLLRKGDWVGTGIQKPLQMAFATARYGEKVGRRRKITDGHKVQYNNLQSTIISPFGPTSQRSHVQRIDVQGRRGLVPGKGDVRISIGTRVVPPGISSSTASSRRGAYWSHARQERLEYSQVASSDVMLLDNEDFMEQPLPRATKSQISFEGTKASSSDAQEAVENTSRGEDCSAYSDQGHGRDKRPSRNGRVEYLRTKDNSSEIGRRESLIDTRSILHPRKQYPSGSQSHNVPRVHRPIFSSSSASIHHPVPQSGIISLLLRSGSSERPDSTVAQVGKSKPTVPISQVLDNETWKTWLVPLCDDAQSQGPSDEEGGRSAQGVTISPGISTAPVHYRTRYSSPKYIHENNDLQTKPQDTTDQASGIFSASTQQFSSNQDYSDIQEHPQGIPRCEIPNQSGVRRGRAFLNGVALLEERNPRLSNIDTREMKFKLKEDKSSSNIHRTKPGRPSISPAQSTSKATKETDPDEVWRKFVFGSSSIEINEIVHDLLQPNRLLGVERRERMALSVIGNPPTEMSSVDIENSRGRRWTTCDPLESPYQPSRLSTNFGSSDVPWNPPAGGTSPSHILTEGNLASAHASIDSQLRHSRMPL